MKQLKQQLQLKKLDNDNLDQKFETLQKFLQNQIIITHKLTSGQLIGVTADNQGFSATEFKESLDVFKTVVIKQLRNEMEYALNTLLGTEVYFIDKEVGEIITEEVINE